LNKHCKLPGLYINFSVFILLMEIPDSRKHILLFVCTREMMLMLTFYWELNPRALLIPKQALNHLSYLHLFCLHFLFETRSHYVYLNWAWTHDPPASTFWVAGIIVYITTPSWYWWFHMWCLQSIFFSQLLRYPWYMSSNSSTY
jgi:hypothetical protein